MCVTDWIIRVSSDRQPRIRTTHFSKKNHIQKKKTLLENGLDTTGKQIRRQDDDGVPSRKSESQISLFYIRTRRGTSLSVRCGGQGPNNSHSGTNFSIKTDKNLENKKQFFFFYYGPKLLCSLREFHFAYTTNTTNISIIIIIIKMQLNDVTYTSFAHNRTVPCAAQCSFNSVS